MKMVMRLLQETAKQADLPEEDRERTVILHINHCMDNSYEFNRVLGSLFRKVVFIGIPYNHLRPPADPAFLSYSAEEEEPQRYLLYRGSERAGVYQGELSGCVREMIRIALEEEVLPLFEEDCRLLILEDGGYHYEVVRELKEKHPELPGRILGTVEQTNYGTARGFQTGETEGYAYPLMSVSRSKIKMNVESVFIAQRVVEELSLYLYSLNTFLEFHRVLLVGYGVIGRRIAQILKQRFTEFTVYDIAPSIQRAAREEGCHVCEEIRPALFDKDTILISITGNRSFSEEMLISFLEGSAERLYLVSASSQEVEFSGLLSMLRKQRPFPDGVELTDHQVCGGVDWYTFCYTGPDGQENVKQIYLVAKGRPVNFYRQDVISLTDCMIDLVFSEILLMAFWICGHPDAEKKLYLFGKDGGPFADEREEEILGRWFRLYGLSKEAGMRAFQDRHPMEEQLRGAWKR